MPTEDIATLMALLRLPGTGNTAGRRALAVAQAIGVPLRALAGTEARALSDRMPGADVTALESRLAQIADEDCHRELRLLERVTRSGVQVLTCTQRDYPAALIRDLGFQAPPLLFVAGDMDLLEDRAAAVVGARDVSERGTILAAECARVFAGAGVPVVSGGAPGVDSAAHAATLRAGGRTLVVLPQGLLTYRGPRDLMTAVEEGRAVILSEFLPDMTWQTHAAVTRNATISALARLTCVIEPKKQGGSVRTARTSIEQGKRVLIYCAPGFEAVSQSLGQAGALPLLDEEGSFEPDYLLSQWESAPEPAEGQAELF